MTKRNEDQSQYFFFFIKLFNLHYTNKQRAYNIEIKNIYKKITTHVLNLMNKNSGKKVRRSKEEMKQGLEMKSKS